MKSQLLIAKTKQFSSKIQCKHSLKMFHFKEGKFKFNHLILSTKQDINYSSLGH